MWDHFVNSMRDAADVAGKKTEQVLEISKLKMQSVSLSNKISKEYKLLGEIVYELQISNTTGEEVINQCIETITRLRVQLAVVNRKIDAMKKAKDCPACHDKNVPGTTICDACDAKIEEPKASTTAQEKTESKGNVDVVMPTDDTAEDEIARLRQELQSIRNDLNGLTDDLVIGEAPYGE